MDQATYRALNQRLKDQIHTIIDTEMQATGEDDTFIIEALAGALGDFALERFGDDDFVSDLGLAIVGN